MKFTDELERLLKETGEAPWEDRPLANFTLRDFLQGNAPALLELVRAARELLGGPEIVDENIGWLGRTASTNDHYQCEFCSAENTDCTLIEHKDFCPVPKLRAALARLEK